jgi:hypothetical protein
VVDIVPWLRRRRAARGGSAAGGRVTRRLPALLVLLATPSVMVLMVVPPLVASGSADPPYVSAEDADCLGFLRDHAFRDDVVFGGPDSEWFAVAYGGTRAVYGDPSYTPDNAGEVEAAGAVLRGRRAAAPYLIERSVDWVFFGPREQKFAPGAFDPGLVPGAVLARRCGQTDLYRLSG